jgi:hypothetical protein
MSMNKVYWFVCFWSDGYGWRYYKYWDKDMPCFAAQRDTMLFSDIKEARIAANKCLDYYKENSEIAFYVIPTAQKGKEGEIIRLQHESV